MTPVVCVRMRAGRRDDERVHGAVRRSGLNHRRGVADHGHLDDDPPQGDGPVPGERERSVRC